MTNTLQIVLRNAMVWRKFIVASLVGNLGQPLLFLLGMGYGLGRTVEEIEGLRYLEFIAPGLAASAVMYSAAFETTYGSYTRLATQSTFEGILMTPVTVEEIAMGEIVWGAIKGCISGFITLACLPLFGVWPHASVVAMVPLLFVAGMIFAALGIIMTSLAANYEFFNYFLSLFVTPLFLFSGIFFSLQTLPEPTRQLFLWLPLSPVVNLARMFCYGHPAAYNLSAAWLYLVGLAVCFSWLGARLLRRRLLR